MIAHDRLANEQNHVWSPSVLKLLGFTSDVYEQTSSFLYQGGYKGKYKPNDLVMSSHGFSLLGKGKHWRSRLHTKEPVQVKFYIEVYSVEVEYLTVEEAKELQEDAPAVKMQVSPNAHALDAATQRIIEACK